MITSVALDGDTLANEYVPAAASGSKLDWAPVAVYATALGTVGG